MNITASLIAAAFLVCGLPVAAGAQDAGTAGSTGASGVDQTFVTQFVRANDREIDQARAELQTTRDPGIALFAKTMIADHTAANGQVAAVAGALGLTFPTSHIAVGSTGATGSGSSMATAMAPRAYMTLQVQEHQAALGLLQGEARNGSSEQLRTLAAQALPVVKAHLAMAQQYLATGRVSPEVTPTPGS